MCEYTEEKREEREEREERRREEKIGFNTIIFLHHRRDGMLAIRNLCLGV
jgi:hypothetical protein